MSGHIFGGPTPANANEAETHWYTTNSEYGRTVMQTRPPAVSPGYKAPSFYIPPRKIPPMSNNAHAQDPIPGMLNERHAEADARMHLTTGPAKQFMQHEMGRFWNNIQETTDAAGVTRAAAVAQIAAQPTDSTAPPVAAGAAAQEQVSTGHSDILTITREGENTEFRTRPEEDDLSHSVPSTASSTGIGTLAPPTGQSAPPTGQIAPPTGQAGPAEQVKT